MCQAEGSRNILRFPPTLPPKHLSPSVRVGPAQGPSHYRPGPRPEYIRVIRVAHSPTGLHRVIRVAHSGTGRACTARALARAGPCHGPAPWHPRRYTWWRERLRGAPSAVSILPSAPTASGLAPRLYGPSRSGRQTDGGWVGMKNWRGWMSIVPARCVPASVCLVFCLFYMPPSLIFFAVACRSPVSARHAVRPSHASSSLPTRLARRACGSGSGLSPAASFPAAWPSSPRQFVGMILVSRLQACGADPSPPSPGPGAFISTAGPGPGLGLASGS